MDYLFNKVLGFIKQNGYKYTMVNEEDEYYYSKNNIMLDNNKIKFDEIYLPKINFNLHSNDFLIIYTQIYKEDDLLQICIDIDDCDYEKNKDFIRVYNTSFGEAIEPYKYYSQSFKDLQLEDNINDFINSIKENKDFEIYKNFDKPLDDNIVFVQINIIMNNKLSKFIKPEKERHNVFNLIDGKLFLNKNNKIKEYFDFNNYSKKKQQIILDLLNSYYINLIIIKKPSNNDIIFGIKGQEFIRKVWHKYENKFYTIINENINL
jgi:hypothetical protein